MGETKDTRQKTVIVYECPELYYTGILTISFGFLISIFGMLFTYSNTFLLLSRSFDEVSIMGYPGMVLAGGFSIIIGGLVMALGFMLLYVSKQFNPKDMEILLYGIFIWYFVDTFASLFYFYEYNAILNTIILIIYLLIFRNIREKYPIVADTKNLTHTD